MILGIDPAKEGAAVLYDPRLRAVTCVWSWKHRPRKKPIYKTIFTHLGPDGICYTATWDLRDGGQIAKKIANECRDLQIGIEDAYISKQNPRAGLRVARFGGEIIGGLSALLSYDVDSVTWVTAAVWRKELLGVNPFTKREQCKKISLMNIPSYNHTITDHLKFHGMLDHVTDAFGVVLWTDNKLNN